MPKRIILEVDSYNDTLILGICTSFSIHKFAWILSENVKINLMRSTDFVIPAKELELHFAFMMDEQGLSHHYYLLDNSSENGFLIPEQKNINFFLFIKDVTDEPLDLSFLMHNISKDAGVSFVFEVKTGNLDKKLQAKWNLLLNDIELHLMNIKKTNVHGKK